MLPASHRLKHDKDFERVFKTGRWTSGGLVTIKYAKRAGGDPPKTGFMVGSKVSKSSAKRNLVKRRMREVVRLLNKKGKISGDFDIIFIAKQEILGKTYHEIEEDIKFALNGVKILR